MTQHDDAVPRKDFTQQPWALWWVQAKRLTRIELRRNLFSWRASWIYFLAFVPTLIIFIHAIFNEHDPSAIGDDTQILAGIVQLYYIRLAVFFGCLGIFSRLIRGEMIERSLHFYLPVAGSARSASAIQVRCRIGHRSASFRHGHTG